VKTARNEFSFASSYPYFVWMGKLMARALTDCYSENQSPEAVEKEVRVAA